MLEYRDSDGIIQVYFDHSRPRIGDYLFYCECQIISWLMYHIHTQIPFVA